MGATPMSDTNIMGPFHGHRVDLTLVLMNLDLSFFENTVDLDQLASDKFDWVGRILLLFQKYVCLENIIGPFHAQVVVLTLSRWT